VIINELLLDLWFHAVESIVGTLEVSFEGVKSCHDFLFDLLSFFVGNSWTKSELSKVTTNSDASTLDQFGIVFGEWVTF